MSFKPNRSVSRRGEIEDTMRNKRSERGWYLDTSGKINLTQKDGTLLPVKCEINEDWEREGSQKSSKLMASIFILEVEGIPYAESKRKEGEAKV